MATKKTEKKTQKQTLKVIPKTLMKNSKNKKPTKKTFEEENFLETSGESQSFLMKRRFFYPFIAVLVLAAAGYLAFKWVVVVMVDNFPITRLELYQELDVRYGKDLKEQMISERLVLNEAKKRKVDIVSQDIDAEIKKTEDQFGGHDALKSLLEQRRISQEDFRKQIKLDLLIKKMFGQEISISDEEVKKYMDENKDSLGEEKDQDKLKNQVREQLKQQKIRQKFQEWLQEALKGSRVVRF